MKNITLIATLVVVSGCLAGCGPSKKEIEQEIMRKTQEEEKVKIENFKSKLFSAFKDPASVQFKKLTLLHDGKGLCGEVNAKNGFGGYVGFRAFGVQENGDVVILREMALDTVKQDSKKVQEIAVKLLQSGNRSTAEKIVADGIYREGFPYWNECVN